MKISLELQCNRSTKIAALCAVCLTGLMLVGIARAEDEPKAEAKTKKVTAGDITLHVPENWKQKQSKSEFRAAELEVPPVDGDKENGEFVVFYFKNGGGPVAANVERWTNQFEADGRSVKVVSGKSKLGNYVLADLSGTYKKSVGPPVLGKTKSLPGWRVMAVLFQTENEQYFLKFDGPAKTVAAAADQFRAAFGANVKEEKPKE